MIPCCRALETGASMGHRCSINTLLSKLIEFRPMAKRSNVAPGNPTLFEMGKPEQITKPIADALAPRPYDIPNLYLGTSSFTASGWAGTFYPDGMKSAEYLAHYSKTFKCVEIDSSFYGTPAPATVLSWYQKTPADFIFAAKVPKIITHDKVLKDCDVELNEFIKNISLLNEKLGPLLLQFPLFDKYKFKTGEHFLEQLCTFLKKLPETVARRFVVEIRNRGWLDETFLDVLREHSVALALTDTSFVPRPWELKKSLNLTTAEFAYIRWLGNRKEIEKTTTTWNKTVVDRTNDLKRWVQFVRQQVSDRKTKHVFLFANNHYAGFGPATIQQFWELWRESLL